MAPSTTREWTGRGTRPEDAGFDRWALWQVETLGSRYWDPTDRGGRSACRKFEGSFGADVFVEVPARIRRGAPRSDRSSPTTPMALVHSPFVRTPRLPRRLRSRMDERFGDMMAYMDKVVGQHRGRPRPARPARAHAPDLRRGQRDRQRAIRSIAGTGAKITGGKALSTEAGTHVPHDRLVARTSSVPRVRSAPTWSTCPTSCRPWPSVMGTWRWAKRSTAAASCRNSWASAATRATC